MKTNIFKMAMTCFLFITAEDHPPTTVINNFTPFAEILEIRISH